MLPVVPLHGAPGGAKGGGRKKRPRPRPRPRVLPPPPAKRKSLVKKRPSAPASASSSTASTEGPSAPPDPAARTGSEATGTPPPRGTTAIDRPAAAEDDRATARDGTGGGTVPAAPGASVGTERDDGGGGGGGKGDGSTYRGGETEGTPPSEGGGKGDGRTTTVAPPPAAGAIPLVGPTGGRARARPSRRKRKGRSIGPFRPLTKKKALAPSRRPKAAGPAAPRKGAASTLGRGTTVGPVEETARATGEEDAGKGSTPQGTTDAELGAADVGNGLNDRVEKTLDGDDDNNGNDADDKVADDGGAAGEEDRNAPAVVPLVVAPKPRTRRKGRAVRPIRPGAKTKAAKMIRRPAAAPTRGAGTTADDGDGGRGDGNSNGTKIDSFAEAARSAPRKKEDVGEAAGTSPDAPSGGLVERRGTALDDDDEMPPGDDDDCEGGGREKEGGRRDFDPATATRGDVDGGVGGAGKGRDPTPAAAETAASDDPLPRTTTKPTPCVVGPAATAPGAVPRVGPPPGGMRSRPSRKGKGGRAVGPIRPGEKKEAAAPLRRPGGVPVATDDGSPHGTSMGGEIVAPALDDDDDETQGGHFADADGDGGDGPREDPLVLAAAAVIEALSPTRGEDAAAATTEEEAGAETGGEHREAEGQEEEDKDKDKDKEAGGGYYGSERHALPEERVSALGPAASVRTFRSEVPASVGTSEAQEEFARRYYRQEAAGRNNNLGGAIRAVDDDDDEGVAEEEGGGRKRRDASSRGASDGEERAAREGAAGDGASTARAEAEGGAERTTMKGYLRDLRRSYAKPKKERRDKKRAVTFLEKEGRFPGRASGDDGMPAAAPADAAPAADDPTAAAQNGQSRGNEGPKVKFVDGQLVIAEDSLLANPAQRASAAQIDAEFGDAVEEDEAAGLGVVRARYDAFLPSNGEDGKRKVGARWSVEETRRFYKALRECGTDFGMMAMFLEGRTRGQLKRKFRAESRRNPRLVDMSLDPRYARRVRLDLSVFGDLEIPDEVPAFVTAASKKEEPDEDEGGGSANKEEPGENEGGVAKKEEEGVAESIGGVDGDGVEKGGGDRFSGQNYDAIFREDADAKTEEIVEEEGRGDGGMAKLSSNGLSQADDAKVAAPPAPRVEAAKPVKRSPAQAPKAKTKAQEAPAVLPLAPVAPGKTKAKKTRFKVKPKVARKMKKK